MRNIGIFIIFAALLATGCSSSKKLSVQIPPQKLLEAKGDAARYLMEYYPVAVEHMEKHKIPASITLAQAVLEGGAGKSKLVAEANNHFGVKADKRWKGETVKAYDNGRWCDFRAYDNALESYEDHSKFLLVNKRYASLFDLDIDDYKGWAHGLKKAGYAEDKNYATKLIAIIERYDLNAFDISVSKTSRRAAPQEEAGNIFPQHPSNSGMEIMEAHGLKYVIADNDDTLGSLSEKLGIPERKLISYNDLYKGYKIKAGDIIYLEKKNSKAGKETEFHTVKENESLYSISQAYGIRLEKIYEMNPQYKNYTSLKVGDVLRLR